MMSCGCTLKTVFAPAAGLPLFPICPTPLLLEFIPTAFSSWTPLQPLVVLILRSTHVFSPTRPPLVPIGSAFLPNGTSFTPSPASVASELAPAVSGADALPHQPDRAKEISGRLPENFIVLRFIRDLGPGIYGVTDGELTYCLLWDYMIEHENDNELEYVGLATLKTLFEQIARELETPDVVNYASDTLVGKLFTFLERAVQYYDASSSKRLLMRPHKLLDNGEYAVSALSFGHELIDARKTASKSKSSRIHRITLVVVSL